MKKRQASAPAWAKGEQCHCGASFDSEVGLRRHLQSSGCQVLAGRNNDARLPSEVAADSKQAADQQEDEARTKRVREGHYADERKIKVALRLAYMRYMKLVPGSHVDWFKEFHRDLNAMAVDTLTQELTRLLESYAPAPVMEQVRATVASHLDVYAGLETEDNEVAFLSKRVPIPKFEQRRLADTNTFAWDFHLDEQLLLLMAYDPVARGQVYDTLTTWRTKPMHSRLDPARIIFDITDAAIFLDHEVFGEAARVSFEEAFRTARTAALRFAIILYADAFCVRRGPHPLSSFCVTSCCGASPRRPFDSLSHVGLSTLGLSTLSPFAVVLPRRYVPRYLPLSPFALVLPRRYVPRYLPRCLPRCLAASRLTNSPGKPTLTPFWPSSMPFST